MKKQLLLISICVLFTSNIGWASCNYTQSGKVCDYRSQSSKCVSKDSKSYDYPRAALEYKKLIDRMQHERATIYNALNLTDEQIQKREELLRENNPIFEQKFDLLLKESFKLSALEEGNAPEREIVCQKRVVKNIKKDIDKLFSCENKEFQKCLTRLQRSKFKEIQRLEKRDYKREAPQKDYYKSNPQMRPFGNPTYSQCDNTSSKKKKILK